MIDLFAHGTYEGKHFPEATSNFGEPLMRIFWRSKAQSKLRSFARKTSQGLAIGKHLKIGLADVAVVNGELATSDCDRGQFLFLADRLFLFW